MFRLYLSYLFISASLLISNFSVWDFLVFVSVQNTRKYQYRMKGRIISLLRMWYSCSESNFTHLSWNLRDSGKIHVFIYIFQEQMESL